jgi:hypothetical protein
MVSEPLAEFTVKDGAAEPVPLRVTVCGEPLALSATERAAVKLPVPEGIKMTETAHVASAARDVPQVFVCVKVDAFVPVMLMPVMVSVAVPEFVSVTVCAVDAVVGEVDGNVSDAGLKES